MGETHVRSFVSEGARVYFTDVLEAEGKALASELGESACFSVADVSSSSDWQRTTEEAEERLGPIGILVNNAGISIRNLIEEFSEEDFRRVIEVNQLGVFLGMRAVIPSMKRAGGGSIVNISSVAGFIGYPRTVAYTASKFAIRGMTKVAASELGQYKIRANSVHPGLVPTAIIGDMDQQVMDSLSAAIPLGRLADPEEVSKLVLFLASDDSAYCTGSEFVVDGGLLAS